MLLNSHGTALQARSLDQYLPGFGSSLGRDRRPGPVDDVRLWRDPHDEGFHGVLRHGVPFLGRTLLREVSVPKPVDVCQHWRDEAAWYLFAAFPKAGEVLVPHLGQ